MKTTIKVALWAVMAAFSAVAYAQDGRETVAVAYDSFVKRVSDADCMVASSSETVSDGYVKCVMFALPKDKDGMLSTYSKALDDGAQDASFSKCRRALPTDDSLVADALKSDSVALVYDNASKSVVIGNAAADNYNVQLFADSTETGKRYAYALTWQTRGDMLVGKAMALYGTSPDYVRMMGSRHDFIQSYNDTMLLLTKILDNKYYGNRKLVIMRLLSRINELYDNRGAALSDVERDYVSQSLKILMDKIHDNDTLALRNMLIAKVSKAVQSDE